MKILVSDMGGVLYSYDPSLDPDKHNAAYEEALKVLGKDKLPGKEQLEGEWEVVYSGLLKIYPIEKGIEKFRKNSDKYQVAIVSTALVKTSEMVLDRIGLGGVAWKIFDISEYGSKKESNAWKKIFEQLPGVDVIVEDGEKNLEAARVAAEELGYNPVVFREMPDLNK